MKSAPDELQSKLALPFQRTAYCTASRQILRRTKTHSDIIEAFRAFDRAISPTPTGLFRLCKRAQYPLPPPPSGARVFPIRPFFALLSRVIIARAPHSRRDSQQRSRAAPRRRKPVRVSRLINATRSKVIPRTTVRFGNGDLILSGSVIAIRRIADCTECVGEKKRVDARTRDGRAGGLVTIIKSVASEALACEQSKRNIARDARHSTKHGGNNAVK